MYRKHSTWRNVLLTNTLFNEEENDDKNEEDRMMLTAMAVAIAHLIVFSETCVISPKTHNAEACISISHKNTAFLISE